MHYQGQVCGGGFPMNALSGHSGCRITVKVVSLIKGVSVTGEKHLWNKNIIDYLLCPEIVCNSSGPLFPNTVRCSMTSSAAASTNRVRVRHEATVCYILLSKGGGSSCLWPILMLLWDTPETGLFSSSNTSCSSQTALMGQDADVKSHSLALSALLSVSKHPLQ